MNAAGRPDKEPASGIEPPPSQQTYKAGHRRVCDAYPCTDGSCSRNISDFDCFALRCRCRPPGIPPPGPSALRGPGWPGPHMICF
jgi:hypothetical protein